MIGRGSAGKNLIQEAAIFIPLVCILLYAGSLGGEFIGDDKAFVVNNPSIKTLEHPLGFFTDPRTGATGELALDVYRPITTLSYAIDYFFWDLNPFGYHLTNIALHALNSILVFALLFFICKNFFAAILSSAIFAFHPVQTEVVCWIAGRSSVLFLFFYILSFILYAAFLEKKKTKFFIFSLVFFFLSLFSKEMAITLPLILILYDLYFKNKEKYTAKILRYAPYAIIAIFYLYLRVTLIKKVGQFGGAGDPYKIFLTTAVVMADYLKVIFFPAKLRAGGYDISLVNSIKDPLVIGAVLLLIALVVSPFFLFKKHKQISFSVLFFLITLLPVLNIIPIRAFGADRFLYLSIIGFCLLTASIMIICGSRYSRLKMDKAGIATSIVLVLIVSYAIRTMVRVKDWKDELTLSRTIVAASPESVWALTRLGASLMERGDYANAIKPLEKAVTISGGYDVSTNIIGECYFNLCRYKEAASQFERIIKQGPRDLKSINMLAVSYLYLQRYDDAEKQFLEAIRSDPGFLNTYLNLGKFYEIRGAPDKARSVYMKALETIGGRSADLQKSIEDRLKAL